MKPGVPLVPVQDEADHFILCPDCGQAIDMRDLMEVFRHEEPDHEPRRLDG